jgi:hypothetical protein
VQERNVPGSNKRAIERRAAIEMDVQARAKAMADAKRAEEQGLAKERQMGQRAANIVGVMSAKEKRKQERERGGNRRRVGI